MMDSEQIRLFAVEKAIEILKPDPTIHNLDELIETAKMIEKYILGYDPAANPEQE